MTKSLILSIIRDSIYGFICSTCWAYALGVSPEKWILGGLVIGSIIGLIACEYACYISRKEGITEAEARLDTAGYTTLIFFFVVSIGTIILTINFFLFNVQ